jgi:dolichyl-phosphate beta-glucosyltransferase
MGMDLTPSPHLSLIIPVYNGDASRIADAVAELRAFLCQQDYASEIILVDDGSANPIVADGVTVLRNDSNRGKGFSVARGMLAAKGAYRVFTDADLAYPPSQINRILTALSSGADVAVACRVLPESRYIMSPAFFPYLFTRHLFSRALNLGVRLTLVRDVRDTQAGLKGFTAGAAESVFTRLSVPGFAFDVEALVIARRRGLTIREIPVEFRYDDEPTTVRLMQDAARMIRDLTKVRWNLTARRYD